MQVSAFGSECHPFVFCVICVIYAGEPQEAAVFTNVARNREAAHHPVCLYDEQALFNSVEYNYPLTMSPIMLVCDEGSHRV